MVMTLSTSNDTYDMPILHGLIINGKIYENIALMCVFSYIW